MDYKTAIRLIQIYGSYWELWDRTCKEFHDKKLREELWNEIAKNFDIPKVILKSKLKSLASTYRREKCRENVSLSKSGDQRVPYKSKWFAYEAFQFLNDDVKLRRESIPSGTPLT
ncbi:uncharacterized protein LOC111362097, partial [Spodoptera litura]|uniref:Uncharacterized protein LOC111362097 n=1 Tax=Spodoptera litura TaxID=69820 RepID=A0A9J7J2A2_SPOLT